MNENLQKTLGQMKGFFNSLSMTRRISLVVIMVLTIGALVAIIVSVSSDTYKSLASGLSEEDTQAIAKILREKNIPTKISTSGNKILVPSNRIDEARLELASAGLPQGGGAGFELFDKNELGMTSFRERINFRRALEGELSRSIRSLSEVRSVRVHIVLPKDSVFKDQQRPASASLVLALKPGRKLNKKQIKGIRQLVSAAVEGMKPENVTVMDGNGTVLARLGDSEDDSSTSERAEYQRMVEMRMENRILELMEPLVGSGHVVAQVTADVDFSKVRETSELYNPEKTVVRSEQRSMEKQQGAGQVASGVAGARSNTPGGPGANTNAVGSSMERSNETINYEVDKKILRAERPQGEIKRLSVAVVVDGTYMEIQDETASDDQGGKKTAKTDAKKNSSGEETKPVYQPRSQEEMARFTNLVKKAVGFNPERGDQVEVSNVPFHKTQEPDESIVAWLLEQGGGIFKKLGLVLLAVVLFLFVLRPIVRFVTPAKTQEVMLSSARPTTVAELEKQLSSPGTAPEALPGSTQQNSDPLVAVRQLAGQNPERVVKVVRGWLEAEQS